MFKLPSIPTGAPVSLALIALNIALYLGQMASGGSMTNAGLLYGPLVQEGQWWRLLTSGFLHGSLLHVGFNMYLLYMLGPQLERSFGSLRFSLMYLSSLVGGALTVMLFDWDQATLGASAAVLGLAAVMGIALHERGMKPQQSPVFGLVVLNLALPLLVPGISFWGHFGGVLAGLLIGYLVIWLPARSQGASTSNTVSIGAAAIVLLTALAIMAAKLGGVSLG
ncbi:rhomboid family intramembrane serine protease [Granulosicoccus antarcticus]|uniref:Rhomboid protease GluP n=1 Tax=Granulosicoccus antarcticus IMCC3135 TaxID=1192854 RepID=A0A2Z2NW66_9GAMM|nr:rhomboid family intramembrane serine protease [Granulosicoccus antarcticus]ASJ75579.1 Rhomboid protease GluP [Granulosicoccus antarcticus IMCC3135]